MRPVIARPLRSSFSAFIPVPPISTANVSGPCGFTAVEGLVPGTGSNLARPAGSNPAGTFRGLAGSVGFASFFGLPDFAILAGLATLADLPGLASFAEDFRAAALGAFAARGRTDFPPALSAVTLGDSVVASVGVGALSAASSAVAPLVASAAA